MASELESLMKQYTVGSVKLAAGCMVEEKTPLQDVISQMKKERTGCVVLMNGKTTTGIFTERDYLTKVVDESVDWKSPIKKFSTPNPVVMKESESLGKALTLMRQKKFRNIPIFSKDGNLLGVLSIQNIIRLLAEHFPAEVMNLPPRLNQFPTETDGG